MTGEPTGSPQSANIPTDFRHNTAPHYLQRCQVVMSNCCAVLGFIRDCLAVCLPGFSKSPSNILSKRRLSCASVFLFHILTRDTHSSLGPPNFEFCTRFLIVTCHEPLHISGCPPPTVRSGFGETGLHTQGSRSFGEIARQF